MVTARWRFDEASQPPNANPSVDGLTAALAGGEPQPIADILDADTVTLPRDAETALGAVVAPEASETYDGFDDEGLPATAAGAPVHHLVRRDGRHQGVHTATSPTARRSRRC